MRTVLTFVLLLAGAASAEAPDDWLSSAWEELDIGDSEVDPEAEEPDPVSHQDRVALHNDCGPIGIRVGTLGTSALTIGLSNALLRDLMRNRLTAARLYGGDASTDAIFPNLYLDVTVIDTAYSVRLLMRRILCPSTRNKPEHGLAVCVPMTSWEEGMLGLHGGDANYIQLSVSERLDSFLAEYLRVNEDSCST